MGMDDEILDISNMLLGAARPGRRSPETVTTRREFTTPLHFCHSLAIFSVLNQLQLVDKRCDLLVGEAVAVRRGESTFLMPYLSTTRTLQEN